RSTNSKVSIIGNFSEHEVVLPQQAWQPEPTHSNSGGDVVDLLTDQRLAPDSDLNVGAYQLLFIRNQ
ncbi:MAG: hypothetical protein AAFY56_22410, partial [Pseudomonadota bacterium]